MPEQKEKPTIKPTGFTPTNLTKREEIAKAAMIGILTNEAGLIFAHEAQCPTIARKAVLMADALLAELESTQK